MKLSSLLIPFLLLPQVVFALTLEQMQKTALDNRALVKRFETEIEKSIESTRIAKSGYYPSFDIAYNTYTIDEATPSERKENSAFSSALRWNIFSGFKDKYSIPIIIFTGYNDRLIHDQARQIDPVAILAKMDPISDIIAAIETAVS